MELALAVIFPTCRLNFKDGSKVTPRSFSSVTFFSDSEAANL